MSIEEFKQSEDNIVELIIVNKGGMPVPVEIKLYDLDNKEYIIKRNASVWMNTDTLKLSEKINSKITKIVLGNKYIPDTNPKDNEYVRN